MDKLKFYLDSNVYYGLSEDTSHLHRVEGERLMKYLLHNKSLVYASDLNATEIKRSAEKGKPKVIETFLNIVNKLTVKNILIEEHKEVNNLANFYIEKHILSKKHFRDLLHIAGATFYGADILVSWNFDDIVNTDRIPKIYAANNERGFHKNFQIVSPMEVR